MFGVSRVRSIHSKRNSRYLVELANLCRRQHPCPLRPRRTTRRWALLSLLDIEVGYGVSTRRCRLEAFFLEVFLDADD